MLPAAGTSLFTDTRCWPMAPARDSQMNKSFPGPRQAKMGSPARAAQRRSLFRRKTLPNVKPTTTYFLPRRDTATITATAKPTRASDPGSGTLSPGAAKAGTVSRATAKAEKSFHIISFSNQVSQLRRHPCLGTNTRYMQFSGRRTIMFEINKLPLVFRSGPQICKKNRQCWLAHGLGRIEAALRL